MDERLDYSGMTVNERLYAAGLLDQWDRAAKSGDRKTMIELLTKVQLVESDAAWTADTILANPAKYGF